MTRPFDGLVIGTGIHLEPKTAALLLTLRAGGADLIATGNLNSTQPETVAYLKRHGIRVIATPTRDAGAHAAELRAILHAEPHLLLDNGGDLFAAWLENPYARLLGGTEETTSGRMRLTPLRDQIGKPILVINDSPIKQFAENQHAVGQSVLESFLRITNRATSGLRVTVFGYGACGQGVAANFRAANATVSVVEVDPVARLRALEDEKARAAIPPQAPFQPSSTRYDDKRRRYLVWNSVGDRARQACQNDNVAGGARDPHQVRPCRLRCAGQRSSSRLQRCSWCPVGRHVRHLEILRREDSWWFPW